MVDPLDALPHRPPFRFLTNIMDMTDGKTGKATWQVTGHEYFFAGHFPDHPVVPGVLIGEALAQLSGLVAMAGAPATRDGDCPSPEFGKLAHIDLRLNHTVTPPATILLESKLERVFGALMQFSVTARIKEKRAAYGSLTLAIPHQDSSKGTDLA